MARRADARGGGGGGGGKFMSRMVTGQKPIHVRPPRPEKERVDMVPRDVVERCIVALFEKRGSTREAAMEDLVGALEGHVSAREVSCKYTTIVSRCVFSLKKGSVREARLAYRAIGILALTLGGGGDDTAGAKDVLAEAFPFLAKTVEASHDMAKVLAAIDGLAVATFAGEDGDDEIERSMDAIWGGVIDPSSAGPGGSRLAAGDARKTTPEALAAAVSAWAFLLTVVHDRYEAEEGESCKDKIALLAKLLDDHDDRGVRVAAGEAIAACVELKLAHDTPPEDMEALNATVSYLATEPSGKGAGDKRRHAGQKDIFRQIEIFLDDGEAPTKSVRTSSSRQSVLKVTTWTKLLQLNFLTRYLGNGFHSHLQHNPLFGETFEVDGDEVEGLPAARKMMSRKQREKKRTLERRRCREAVWKEKNKFGLPEEEPERGTTALMLLPALACCHHMLPPVHRQPHLLPPTAPATASHMLPPVQQPILLLDACGGGMSIYYQKINQRVAVLEKAAVSVHESRASTREAALASLVGALEGFVPAHFIGWHHRGEIVRGCCASIKKGAAKEARLALRAVALLAVTLGPGSKRRILPAETYNPLEPGPGSKKIMAETFPLVSRILEVSTDASLVIAALESLAVVAFVDVAAENMDDTEACMKALWGLIRPSTGPKLGGAARKTSPHVLAAAVSAWTLVLTTTDGWKKKKAASSSPTAGRW
uniref:Interferon-related developmental regulator N-terminal domain-containing protein n=1 Tax=Oryza rufipogon TaxID=4529 RepID=A0A0E0NBS9_ORYRU